MNKKLKNEELNRPSVNEYKSMTKLPIVVVLDNIRSFNNTGSVFRTSDAFGVSKIFLCGITPKPPHREIQKTALGATESVEWEYQESTQECIERLKNDGYQVLAIEQAENKVFLNEAQFNKGKYAVVFGNEVNGVSQEVVSLVDTVVEIPQHGTKHSLNISVSAGVVLWEMFRQLA